MVYLYHYLEGGAFMKRLLSIVLTTILLSTFSPLQGKTNPLEEGVRTATDYWVVDPINISAQVDITTDGVITLSNGLVERTIDTSEDGGGATTSYRNLYKDYELLDHTEAEGIIGLDGQRYTVGGTGDTSHFRYSHYTTGDIEAEINWTPKPYISEVNPWPALGQSITLTYDVSPEMPTKYHDLQIEITYDIYKGIPVISKRMRLFNNGSSDVKITYFANEVLAVKSELQDQLYAETDYNGGSDLNNNRNLSVQWTDQGNNSLLKTHFDMGPNWNVGPDSSFDGLKTYELLHSVDYYEWKQIEIQEMYRIIAPWTNEVPLFLHLISNDSNQIRQSVDSCADVGFDMVIQSFGSGINLESTNQAYINRIKDDYDYAHSKGIEIGGYTLACVKDYRPVNGPEAINGDYSKITRCLATDWSEDYWNNVKNFLNQTGSDFIEIDGPYHFFKCTGGPTHQHEGLEDSRYAQWKSSTVDMFKWLKENDISINAPDWMYLNGSNKAGIGYEEIGWSQPRQEQLLISRLYNYKGTFLKTPSMGWSFVPIDQYHGGGSQATFEPLSANIKDYEWAIAQSFAAGVQPCFRGRRLYDTEGTKNIVKYWVDFYKRYKEILNSKTIHVKPPKPDPDNSLRTTEMDVIMHANSGSTEKAMMMIFNQTDEPRTETITIPLYYSGLTDLQEPPCPVPGSDTTNVDLPKYGPYPPPYPTLTPPTPYVYPSATTTNKIASFYHEGDERQDYRIDSNGNIELTLTLEPMSYTWYTVYDSNVTPDAPIPYPNATPPVPNDNLALGKGITSSAPFTNTTRITDGLTQTDSFSDSYPHNGLQWVQLDLEKEYNVDNVNLWHYFGDTRQYKDVIVQLSTTDDFSSNVTTVFNNDQNNSASQGIGTDDEYTETSEGKELTFDPVKARYIRLWSNGSNKNGSNHYVDVQIYGEEIPALPAVKGHWEFEDNGQDTSGNNFHGTLNGSSSYTTDSKQGEKSLLLDGVDAYMMSNTVTNITDNVTISGWVKQTNQSDTQIILHNGDTSYNGYGLLTTSGGHLNILCGSIKLIDLNSTMPLNEWVHLSIVRRDGLWEFYYNGQKKTLSDRTTPKEPSNVGTFFGANNRGSENFKGVLDDFRIYEDALSQDMIQLIMEQ